MTGKKKRQFGKLPPRYSFALNPHAGTRCSQCPNCRRSSHPRKFPLLVHIDNLGLIVFGITCRYCAKCEFIVAHQDELENLLEQMRVANSNEETIGSAYLVLGTVERKYWQKHLDTPSNMEDTLDFMADFKKYYDIQFEPAGWYPEK